jgi:Tfp pilus assembly protein PilN
MRPINLLPPEVAKERSRRRRVFGVFVLGLVYVVALIAGVLFWDTRVQAARDEVAAQQDENRALERELVAIADAGILRDAYQIKAALVREALASDVDWGIILNDLSRLLPPRVWVESVSGNLELEGEIPGVIGQMTFSGVGFEFPDVSAWLRSLDSEDFVGITGTWVNTASEGGVGNEPVVNFNSTAVLTQAATTNRADDLIPEVP